MQQSHLYTCREKMSSFTIVFVSIMQIDIYPRAYSKTFMTSNHTTFTHNLAHTNQGIVVKKSIPERGG